MRIVHLTASPFFGGPERQMAGLAQALPTGIRSIFLSFPERGLCEPFLEEVSRRGFTGQALVHNAPHYRASMRELTETLHALRADVLCCHGYKADLLGCAAARKLGIPVIAVARGWTAATWKVRVYEAIDRLGLWMMDRVVCVSEAQAAKVRRVGLPTKRVTVIRNAIHIDRFGEPDDQGRAFLQSFFRTPRRLLIGAAGRFSPEKGFDQLVAAAALVVRQQPEAGFLVFGAGPLEDTLKRQIDRLGLQDHVVLAGFREDLDRWLPNFDVFTLPSYTEGLPNVVLESLASRVPVVATAVGGTPEVLTDGEHGHLVPPGQPAALADRLLRLLADDRLRQMLGMNGYHRVREDFTFESQASQYVRLFEELLGRSCSIQEQPAQASVSYAPCSQYQQ